ncbi:CO(2)-response secreted protease [Striga hermonthica]|uniref:CO(2)-response secreted protease n=1 Tax=Striga hermonthica TaxID=68872 RepID=A0A9N7RQN2_STRHE|nr:CO(2)-response secreted protease [Striga hermonthica]
MEIPHRNILTIEVYLLAVQWCFKKFKNLNWTSEKCFLNNEEAVQLLNKPDVSCSDYGNLAEDILDMFETCKGWGINLSALRKNPIYALIDGASAKVGFNLDDEESARYCLSGSLNIFKVNESIILCKIKPIDDNLITQNFKQTYCDDLPTIGMPNHIPTPIFAHHTSTSGVACDEDGADTIIGFLDSGIWPESESFNDIDMGPIPTRWRGKCMEAHDFTSSSCNRYYANSNSPRDETGPGTHVTSTAVGRLVPDSSYYGLINGTARDSFPRSRVSMYGVCTDDRLIQCSSSFILKWFDDATADGVDVLSLSLTSSPSGQSDFSKDVISIGAFHATERGITVVCAAVNKGSIPDTVVNATLWIFTVAATTTDRELVAGVLLGGGHIIKVMTLPLPNYNLQFTPSY